ncbi:unnamed protein product [Meloidogyne enterolobii]|uniref:Uncharacterized protein n=2 Tax=Meloidogyne enterolobii TaxID=390850 RepID=A0ACB1B958_MELEN
MALMLSITAPILLLDEIEISRFFIGFNSGLFCLINLKRFYLRFSGINTGLASIYLSEIAPINLRGAVGCMSNVFLYTVFQFALVVGLPFTSGDEENWHLIFLLSYIPLSVQLTLLGFFCPESPKYCYIVHENFMEAERSLQLLRGRNDVTTIVPINASGGCLAAYLSIVFIAVYVVFFSFGFVAIIETYLSDLFPSGARTAGCSASTLASKERYFINFAIRLTKEKPKGKG